MFAVIFGRPGCPYCVRAVQIAEQLTEQRDDFKFRYVDIHAEGITKEDLAKSAGKPVNTVPQIFLDEQHIGGCDDMMLLERQGRLDELLARAAVAP